MKPYNTADNAIKRGNSKLSVCIYMKTSNIYYSTSLHLVINLDVPISMQGITRNTSVSVLRF